MERKHIYIMLLVAGILAGLWLLVQQMHKSSSKKFVIGVLQTASHPALDAARDGFMQELTQLLNNDVEFVIRNAEGNISNARAIAEYFKADSRLNGVFAIATPAVQAMARLEKQRPIFIAAVSNPQALGVISATTNVCGTTDAIDVAAELDAMEQMLPTAKKIALLFNPAEVNSSTMAQEMTTLLEKHNKEVITFGIHTEGDVLNALSHALQAADVIVTPVDNTVASSITAIARQAQAAKKPLVVSDNLLVAKGALMARGVDYFEGGKQTAHIAQKVLQQGIKPYELPIKKFDATKIFVNKKVLHDLNLTIPQQLENSVVLVD